MKGVTYLRAQATKKVNKMRRRQVIRAVSLIICFPMGLYVMWTRKHWPRFVKTAVSAVTALALVAILGPMTNPPERETGGIHLADEKPQVDVYGPEAPADREVIEIYAPRYTAVVLDPTPTPQPITVFCNNGGRHYHTEDCKYVKEDTPYVSLSRAVEAGYTKCSECDAPEAY